MLGTKRELRSRLPVHVVPLPIIYTGQHWRADPRPRWSVVMPSRFSVSQELARHKLQDWLGRQDGTAGRSQVGCQIV